MAETQLTEAQIEDYKSVADVGPGIVEAEQDAPKAEQAADKSDTGHGHRKWDGQKEAWVDAIPARDEKGRFARVRESLAKSQQKTAYIQALQAGAVEPTEDMPPELWAAARNAQILQGTDRIKAPDFGPEKTAEGAEKREPSNAEQSLSPEETQHFEKYETFMSDLVAKRAIDPETKSALEGFGKAIDAGIPHDALAVLGHVISDTENPHEVLLALGKDPSSILVFSRLAPQGMAQAVHALSKQISALKVASQPTPKAPKPAPPAPVGARARSTAFDVSDESLSADEWAKQRNQQLAQRRR
jgi:hypothetical protein